MGVLDEILAHKIEEVQALEVNSKEKRQKGILHLKDFLNPNEVNIIAEIKRSSPSAGFIKEIDLDSVLRVYQLYAKSISVLTDDKFFGGSFDFLKVVSQRVNLPVLCKDFIISERQIDKAYLSGADIVLLIVRILDDKRLSELYDYAKSKGMDVLVEVHKINELGRIKELKPGIVGVNSRDLDTLEISLSRAKTILESIDFDCIRVAESGIKTKKDIEFLRDVADCFLIGESILKSDDMEEKFKELI